MQRTSGLREQQGQLGRDALRRALANAAAQAAHPAQSPGFQGEAQLRREPEAAQDAQRVGLEDVLGLAAQDSAAQIIAAPAQVDERLRWDGGGQVRRQGQGQGVDREVPPVQVGGDVFALQFVQVELARAGAPGRQDQTVAAGVAVEDRNGLTDVIIFAMIQDTEAWTRYKIQELTKGFKPTGQVFENGMAEAYNFETVIYEYEIKVEKASTDKPSNKRRSQFRVASKNIATLYETVATVEVRDVADIFTKAKRSQVMSRVRGTGNKNTELRFIAIMRTHGITGWRRGSTLTGRPDFVFPTLKLAVFVDGCFWHGCPKHGTKPKQNARFWREKIARNQARDRLVNRVLRADGWRVLRIWEHALARWRVTRTLARIFRAL